MIKLSETTRKRQSAFYLTAITYTLVYVFTVTITGVQEVGLKVNLPEEFAPTVLFVISVFLGFRYFVDIWGDANFHHWVDVENGKILDINSGIEQSDNLLTLVSADLTPHSRELLTSQKPLCLPADLSNFRSKLAAMVKEGNTDQAKVTVEENRSWVKLACKKSIKQLKRKRLVTYFGIANIISVFIFDIVLPVMLFMCTVYIWFAQPTCLKYPIFL